MQTRTDLYHGLFRWHPAGTGPAHLSAHEAAPRMVPDPQTGRLLKVASVATCSERPVVGHGIDGGLDERRETRARPSPSVCQRNNP